MVLACDRSNADSLGGLVFVQLTDPYPLGDDFQLVDEPFDAGAHVFDGEAAGSLFERFLEAQRLLSEDVQFVVFFVLEGVVAHDICGHLCDFGGLSHFGIIHRQKLHFLHPSPEAIDHIFQLQ